MTENKMPDVIWAYNDGCTVEITCPPTEHDIFPHAKYLRAEPVEELLKQARDALALAAKHSVEAWDYAEFQHTVNVIDQFLTKPTV